MELLAQAHGNGGGNAPCFPFLFIALAIVVAVLLVMGRRASFGRTLHHVAVQLGGRVLTGTIFQGYDRVQFQHAGQRAELRFSQERNNRRYTHLEIEWAGPRLRCEVYPEGFLASLRKLLGMEDIAIGSPQFDWRFIITGDDIPAVKSLLNSQVQAAIFNMANYVQGMHVRFSPRSLTVTSSSKISDFARLIEFTRLCRDLYDAAQGTLATGIEFLDGQARGSDGDALTLKAGAATSARCMVCGESLESDVIYCRSCRTPHHRDCWSYSGGCSTYGCREKTFVRS